MLFDNISFQTKKKYNVCGNKKPHICLLYISTKLYTSASAKPKRDNPAQWNAQNKNLKIFH